MRVKRAKKLFKAMVITLIITVFLSMLGTSGFGMLSSASQKTPILSFEQVGEIYREEVFVGTEKTSLNLPTTISITTLEEEIEVSKEIEIQWNDNETYQKDVPGEYKFEVQNENYEYDGEYPYALIIVKNPMEETAGSENEEKLEQVQEKEIDINQEEIEMMSEGYYPEYPSSAVDYSDRVQVTNWDILDYSGVPLSTSNPAIPYGDYKFTMTWMLNLAGLGTVINEGDYFVLKVPQNSQLGRWNAIEVGWMPFKDALGNIYGEWCIVNQGDDLNEIHVKFGANAAGYQHITGISLTSGEGALKNYTMKGLTQDVTFAGITKPITFLQHQMTALTDYDSKQFAIASDSRAMWQIHVNNAGPVQLAGDRDLWNYGNPPEPTWQQENWGQAFTDKNNVYVEDLLDPGVNIEAIFIQAQTVTPIDLPATGSLGGVAGYVPSYNSYVLVDYEGELQYREEGQPGVEIIEPPKRDNSFARVYPNEGESYASFKARLLPYQYGVYSHAGTILQYQLVINFGKLGRNGDQKKYTDLTDTAYSGKIINGKQIPNFAVMAASECINNGYYSEANRDRLEEYFTEVYGDNNVIDGQVSRYVVEILAKYPPSDTSLKKTNTAQITMNDKTETRSAEGTLNNPSAQVVVDPNAGRLYKYDVDTNLMIQGASFKLQKLNGSTWQDYTPSDGGQMVRQTNAEGFVEWRQLPIGTYRFYEVTPATGYSLEKSQNYDIGLGTCVSSSFSIVSNDANGEKLYLWNKKVITAQYKVEHYLEQSDGSYLIQSADTQTLSAEVGQSVTASPNTYPTHTFDNTVSGTIQSGIVLEDGSLVLKLYYRFKTMDFVFYKVSEEGTPLIGVEFQLYKCKKVNESGHIHSETVENKNDNCWDTANPITSISKTKGKVTFSELETGDYMLVETKTNNGYELPMGQWLIQIDVTSQSITITGKGVALPPAFYIGADSQGKDAYYLPNFENRLLVVTGGSGTAPFTIVGILLIGSAVIAGITTKKKKKQF